VDWAMRYANPSTASRIAHLQQQGCDRLLIVPLYPQYAAATTATACDQVFRALMKLRWQPTVRVAPPYYDDPHYIEAVAKSIRAHISGVDWTPDALVVSFHGMPRKYWDKGDPYYRHCQATSRLLQQALGWPVERWHLSFQSRFGNDPWLEPYTIDLVKRLARTGTRRLIIAAPGFAADCLETLEELDMENRGVFFANGGDKFSYVPCLNDGVLGMTALAAIVRRELQGWI
jgi:protoporphyrin/coproporphyrin ferrochelatase